MSSLVRCLSLSLISHVGCLLFCCILGVICIFWIHVLYKICVEKYSRIVYDLSFHALSGVCPLSPPSSQGHSGNFLGSSTVRTWQGSWRHTAMQVWLLRTEMPGFFFAGTQPMLSFQQFIKILTSLFLPVYGSSRVTFLIHLSLQILGGSLSCYSYSLMCSRKVIDYCLSSFFL